MGSGYFQHVCSATEWRHIRCYKTSSVFVIPLAQCELIVRGCFNVTGSRCITPPCSPCTSDVQMQVMLSHMFKEV